MATLRLRLDPRNLIKGADQSEAALENVANEARRTESAVEMMSRAQMRSGRAMRTHRGAIQNTAFQLQDIATQLSMGTAASVALGQQLPQLLGGFGALGAVIGAVVAVGIPLAAVMSGVNNQIIDFNALFPVMSGSLGAFEGIVTGLGNALTFLAENLERILFIAATAATMFAGRFVAGLVAARLATMTLAGALTFLRAALIRTGIGALVVGVGELVYQFSRLATAVGGVGEAFGMVRDVFVEVGGRVKSIMDGLQLAFTAAAQHLQAVFMTSIGKVLGAFMEMTWQVAEGLNSLFNTDTFSGAAIGPTVGHFILGGQDALGSAESNALAAVDAFSSAGAPLESVQAIRDAVAGVNAELVKTPKLVEETGKQTKKTAKETAEDLDKIKDQFESIGGSAIDRLIDGTQRWQDALSDVLKEMAQLLLKKNLLAQMGSAGDASDSLGTTIFKAALGGFTGMKFFDSGGNLPVGQTGIVGEYGPEMVTATSSGAQITGRRATSQGGQQAVDVRVSFDDDGGWRAYVNKVGYQAAATGSQMAVGQVKESLPGWMPRLNTDGALA